MQHNNHRSSVRLTEFQQLRGRWTTLLSRLYEDPKVSQLMDTRIGQYLSSHPFLALTALVFSVMAALPVGLFLTFALATIIMSAVGFVVVELFLLFVAGLTLLGVLSGITLFSVVVAFIFNASYISITNILNYYYPQLAKGKVEGNGTECHTSGLKEMQ